nr:cucumber peeling cupredoxin-like [Ipomoea batatas]
MNALEAQLNGADTNDLHRVHSQRIKSTGCLNGTDIQGWPLESREPPRKLVKRMRSWLSLRISLALSMMCSSSQQIPHYTNKARATEAKVNKKPATTAGEEESGEDGVFPATPGEVEWEGEGASAVVGHGADEVGEGVVGVDGVGAVGGRLGAGAPLPVTVTASFWPAWQCLPKVEMEMNRVFCMAVLGALAMATMLQPGTAQTAHVVGDNIGWAVPSNGAAAYSNWASGKTFNVGDILGQRLAITVTGNGAPAPNRPPTAPTPSTSTTPSPTSSAPCPPTADAPSPSHSTSPGVARNTPSSPDSSSPAVVAGFLFTLASVALALFM